MGFLNTLTYCRKMLGGQLYTFNHFVPWKQANVVRWYICATKHKVNNYNRSLTQSSDCVSIWVDHQVLNVSRDWNPAIHYYNWKQITLSLLSQRGGHKSLGWLKSPQSVWEVLIFLKINQQKYCVLTQYYKRNVVVRPIELWSDHSGLR